MTDSETARGRVIAAMEESAAEYGLPRSCGRVYGHLYFADEPLSQAALAERTGYAQSTVSDALETLGDLYLVYRRPSPEGGRLTLYEAERDLWEAVNRVAEESGRREIELMRRALDDAEATLETADGEAAETDLQRVRDLQELYRQSAVVLDLLQRVPVERLLSELARFDDDVDAEDLPEAFDVPGDGGSAGVPGEKDPDGSDRDSVNSRRGRGPDGDGPPGQQ